MATIAIYSPKGGVGKTSIAVNLACCAAQSGRRTLLWDLDGQAAASFALGQEAGGEPAIALFTQGLAAARLIRPTAVIGLDILPADASLHALATAFDTLDKRRRLQRIIESVAGGYDRILLDCPPGLDATSDQLLRAADLVIVPVVPTPFAKRALDMLTAHLAQAHRKAPVPLPVFSMADRRRLLHREALAAEPDWPVIPQASAIERAPLTGLPIAAADPRTPASKAFATLWRRIEARLAADSV